MRLFLVNIKVNDVDNVIKVKRIVERELSFVASIKIIDLGHKVRDSECR